MIKYFDKSKEIFIKILPIILLVIGLLFLVLSIFVLEKDSTKSTLLKELGSAMLIGGLFSFLLKTIQYYNILKEELSNLIFENKFLLIRKDLEELWRKISSAMYIDKFPELSDELNEVILLKFFPIKNYYYNNYILNVEVNWYDRADSILETTEQLIMEIIPSPQANKIPYNYEIYGVKRDYPIVEIEKFEVNGENLYESISTKEEDFEERGIKHTRHNYQIELKGENKYKILRVIKRRIPLNIDPYTKYEAKNLIRGAKVKVIVNPDDINVKFLSIGTTEDFVNQGFQRDIKHIDMEFKGIIFPMQGCVLFYSKK